MIKIQRCAAPSQLTDEAKRMLTEKYKSDKSAVWNKSYIRDTLSKMSHGKCCYCESDVTKESKYLTVEHFHPKSIYPNEVVEWNNLLPSCTRCNSEKGNHDTVASPIIDPSVEDPKDFLYMKDYTYRSRDRNTLGINTIKVLDLNDSKRCITPRFEIGTETAVRLSDLEERFSLIADNEMDEDSIRKIRRTLRDLLRLAQPTESYSATTATVLLSDKAYANLKHRLVELGQWDEEMYELERVAEMANLTE